MELVEIPRPEPGKGQVRLRVQACGVCHGEAKIIEGWANAHPRIPGHEVVGIVEKLGEDAQLWEIGQRGGIGWDGGHNQTTALGGGSAGRDTLLPPVESDREGANAPVTPASEGGPATLPRPQSFSLEPHSLGRQPSERSHAHANLWSRRL